MQTHASKPHHIYLVVKTDRIECFLKLIEGGFKLKVKTGLSIRELLCVQLGISEDYFENRIQTIFLDGMPVDNADKAWVNDGARIALSAAMPGLVGATFRKGGLYASFRGTISYSSSKNPIAEGEGKITLKFFNMIARELKPLFLQKGILVEGNIFQTFVLQNMDVLKAACALSYLNSEEVNIVKLLEMNWENTEIFLQITPAEKS